tara:strand:- start:1113 stop:2849 length:1737 start_codon:yes stop_codon:yes gene_type:complete
MDDKRTLLAFLLIGLIFVLSPYYYEWMGMTPKPEGPTPEEVEDTKYIERENRVAEKIERPIETGNQQDQDRQKWESSEVETAQQEYVRPATKSFEYTPQNVYVETPLLNLVFSTKGGVLTSAELTEYQLYDQNPVQLISSRGKGLVLSLQQIDRIEDLSQAEFVPDQEVIRFQEGQKQLIMTAQLSDNRTIQKVYTFNSERYGFDLEVRYKGFSEDVDVLISWNGGVPFTEKNPEMDLLEMSSIASFNNERIEIQVEDEENEAWDSEGGLQWIGARNKYFLTAIIPLEQERRLKARLNGDRMSPDLLPNYKFEIGRQLSSTGSWKSSVYVGPLDYDILIQYGVGLEQAIDFGYPIIRSVTKFLLIVFKEAYKYIPNYGWIIILFAVVIKVIFYPFQAKSLESMRKMQEIQPKISALREKYKNDSQRLSQETMKLYKKEGVNPVGGCLPMLPQMPIFFALYTLFSSTIELRQAPFALWVTDLSMPDEVMIGGFGLRVLPLLVAFSMFVQQKMTMKDPKQAAFVYILPVFMAFVFWGMSSGLNLYWMLFNVLAVGQQLIVNRSRNSGQDVSSGSSSGPIG